ncbi:MAG: hypothetical protein CFE46_05210 [Burkholderiales bacterium PBB6]|nr:MAG: hypothetical protein CFE46_05210 [Burkholderiales bacterium PBB6]
MGSTKKEKSVQISWRRLGYLGFMIPFAAWGLACVLFGHNNFKAIRIAFLLAAAAVWLLGTKLNGDETDADGKAPHLTFGLPMQWGGLLASTAGFVLTLL